MLTDTSNQLYRSTLWYGLAVIGVMILGLAERKYGRFLPMWLYKDAGDALWALCVYLFIGFLRPGMAIPRLALAALAVAFFIEFTQLYHAPWIDAVRSIRLAALILGSGFLWSDLVCYTIGVAIGVLAEWVMLSRQTRTTTV